MKTETYSPSLLKWWGGDEILPGSNSRNLFNNAYRTIRTSAGIGVLLAQQTRSVRQGVLGA